MDNECKVQGIILSAKKLWWIKVNRKAFRTHLLDGATFPHLVKVKYKVDDKEYEKNKYIRSNEVCPEIGESVLVYYKKEKPSKVKRLVRMK